MKILIVSHEYPPIGGGGSNACYFLSREYVKSGHDVTIVTSCFRDLPTEEETGNIKVIRVKAIRKKEDKCSFPEMLTFLCSAIVKCDKLARKEHFDVCQVFFGIPSGPVGWYLKKKYQIPYLIRFGGGDIPGTQKRFGVVYKILAPFIRIIWKNADYLVANSEGLMERAQSFESKYPIGIISNGVDIRFFQPIQKQNNNPIEILFVSRLIERKGLQFVIPHMNRINEQLEIPAKLIIVGDGPYRDTLESLCREHHVEKYVSFEGKKNKQELLPYYQSADLFILPSKWEGMPNVVLEAMATGLPIIMTPCEGSKELIQENGKIVEIERFPEEIINICQDTQQRAKMGKLSAEIARTQFTWYNTAKAYEELFCKCGKK